ncbi:MAG: protoheme IX farnesyltransferase [Bacteroidia bacterium]|nr:protoheme IX farnesyltransferase [Bacteroidia bacterium]MDW8416446.1 protoheme IX farnesyltransferase [Bacteroidia bacterium]
MVALISLSISFLHKLRLAFQLTKPRLSIVVVFSAVMGALIAGTKDIWHLIWLAAGGYCLTGSANAANQIWERDSDALMERTRHRPIPAGLLSVTEALFITLLLLGISIVIFQRLHWDVALLGLVAWALYVFAYTPLKHKGPIAVLVGAIPGALPPVIGYWSAHREVTPLLIALFVLQFSWQFPHFWVIAWLSHADYEKARFRMLPFPANQLRKNGWAISISVMLLPALSLVFIPVLPWKMWLWLFLLGVTLTGFSLHQLNLSSPKALRYLLLSLTAYLSFLYIGLWLLL